MAVVLVAAVASWPVVSDLGKVCNKCGTLVYGSSDSYYKNTCNISKIPSEGACR